MNGTEEFNRLFFQYNGVEFTFEGKEYYMHMNNPTKGCAIDIKTINGDWDMEHYKYKTLEEMITAKVFNGKSFSELLENIEVFEEIFYT